MKQKNINGAPDRRYLKEGGKKWRSPQKQPPLFDLVLLLLENEKTQVGWYTGSKWDSRLPISNKIMGWSK